jgi:ADP-heptose:LPS heptosyltransferase
VGIPLVRIAGLLRRRRGIPAEVRRVGVMTSTTLGDTLLASGAVQDVQAIWPDAELVFFAAAQNRAAAELLPAVDRVAEFALTRPLAAIACLRREKLDVLVDFSGWQRLAALLTARSGAKFTAGFRRPGQHRHFAYDFVAEHRGDRHETENFRAMVVGLREKAGAAAEEFHALALREDVWQTELDKQWRDAVVFHCWATGTAHSLREWPEQRWVELAGRLHQRWPAAKFVLTGGAADVAGSEELVGRLRAAGFSAEVFSASGLDNVARLMRAARLVVSVNTGTMHLAAIVGAPVVSINGPNRHGRWGPVGARAVSVEAPGQGCGYLDLGWEWRLDPSANGVHSNCMERISVDAVMAAVDTALGSDAGAARAGSETSVGAH